MTKRDKRLQKMRQNPKNVTYGDYVGVLQDFGFTVRDGRGSHIIIKCTVGDKKWRLTIARPHGGSKHVKRPYVKQAIKAIDEVIDAIEEQKNDDTD